MQLTKSSSFEVSETSLLRSRRIGTAAIGPFETCVPALKMSGYRSERKRRTRGQIDAHDPNVWSGRAVQEVFIVPADAVRINVSGLCLERFVLRAIMDISAHAI
jgi:hypothetical protein